ncbi:hypothetical protein [Streptomyces sirii]|uniref:hypothetical protein n=1 Tax=Streptomyces sirii TaxID=3127701 RepID=UPI003D36ECB7
MNASPAGPEGRIPATELTTTAPGDGEVPHPVPPSPEVLTAQTEAARAGARGRVDGSGRWPW